MWWRIDRALTVLRGNGTCFDVTASLIIISNRAIHLHIRCRPRVCIIDLIYVLCAMSHCIWMHIHRHLLGVCVFLKNTCLIWITASLHVIITHSYWIIRCALRRSHVFFIHWLQFTLFLAMLLDIMDIRISLIGSLIHICIHFLMFYLTGLK